LKRLNATESRKRKARKELSAGVNEGRNKVGKREEQEHTQKWKKE
jgi:hypothetical protein